MNLKEIKERANKATPGPWRAGRSDTISEDVYGALFKNVYGPKTEKHDRIPDQLIPVTEARGEGENAMDNAAFIAHSRADIPALVDWIERAAFVMYENKDKDPRAAALLAELEGE